MKKPEPVLPEGVRFFADDSAEQAAGRLADQVAAVLSQRLARAGEATLAVSGGSTPVRFFECLSHKDLDWSGVTVVLVDERWVPETDSASNTALVKKRLLQDRASEARLVSLIEPGQGAQQALPVLEHRLKQLALPLDVLVLGMGNDGHTASLFPDAPELAFALSPPAGERVAIMTPPSQPQTRLTLTLPVLESAGFTALLLRGEEKLTALRLAAQVPEKVSDMPVRAFLKTGLAIYWSP